MLPSNCLSVTHFAQVRSFHCTVISFNRFPSPAIHLGIYTILRNQYSYPHCVCTNSFHVSSNFLHTMLLFSFTSLPVVGYNFCTGPVYYRYLRNLLDACWMRNRDFCGVCKVEQIQGYMLTQMWEDKHLLRKKNARDVRIETFKARL
jgi:hypothetical protein